MSKWDARLARLEGHHPEMPDLFGKCGGAQIVFRPLAQEDDPVPPCDRCGEVHPYRIVFTVVESREELERSQAAHPGGKSRAP